MPTKISINLPNEYFSTEVNIENLKDFTPSSDYGSILFGWIDKQKSLYISITKDEYEKLLAWKSVNNFQLK
jgi:hypothetical protein